MRGYCRHSHKELRRCVLPSADLILQIGDFDVRLELPTLIPHLLNINVDGKSNSKPTSLPFQSALVE